MCGEESDSTWLLPDKSEKYKTHKNQYISKIIKGKAESDTTFGSFLRGI